MLELQEKHNHLHHSFHPEGLGMKAYEVLSHMVEGAIFIHLGRVFILERHFPSKLT